MESSRRNPEQGEDMSVLSEIQSRGAGVALDDSGKLDLNLSRVPVADRAAVLSMARQHKQSIIDALLGWPTGLPVTLDHPRDCPQWWRGCLAGCEWYHPGGGDFCWKVDRAWWETPYSAGLAKHEPCLIADNPGLAIPAQTEAMT